jgi:rhodanese-related sulfurtransferase
MRTAYFLPLVMVGFLLGCSDSEDATCQTNPALCAPEAGLPDGGGSGDLGRSDAISREGARPYSHEDIPVATLKGWLDAKKVMNFIDARELSEYNAGYISGATLLPWTSGVFKKSLSRIDSSKPTVIYCRSGYRSNVAAVWLVEQGYKPVYDVLGGFLAWSAAGYPVAKP